MSVVYGKRHSFFEQYGKAIGSVVFAGLVTLYMVLHGDNRINNDEKVQIAIAVTTAIATFVVPIAPQWRWGKTATNALGSALLALSTALLGGMDSSEWILVVLAALSVLGVGVLPAVSGAKGGFGGFVAPFGADSKPQPPTGDGDVALDGADGPADDLR